MPYELIADQLAKAAGTGAGIGAGIGGAATGVGLAYDIYKLHGYAKKLAMDRKRQSLLAPNPGYDAQGNLLEEPQPGDPNYVEPPWLRPLNSFPIISPNMRTQLPSGDTTPPPDPETSTEHTPWQEQGGSMNWDNFLQKYGIPAGSALAGFLTNRDKTQTSNTSGTSSGSTFSGTDITPTQTPENQQFMNDIRNKYSSMLNEDPNLTGFTASGLRDINRGSDLQSQNLEGILAARGITGPAAANALGGVQQNRFNQATQFRSGIPLVARQLRSDMLGKAGEFFSRLPVGNSTTSFGGTNSSSTGSGTQVAQGDPWGGGLGSLMIALAHFNGLNKGVKPYTG